MASPARPDDRSFAPGRTVTTAWTSAELDLTRRNADLFVAPSRDDGVTYGTSTQTWALVVDDQGHGELSGEERVLGEVLDVASAQREAARTGDSRCVRQAVLADPDAASTLTPTQIWELCDRMTLTHADGPAPVPRRPARRRPGRLRAPRQELTRW